MQLPPPSEVEQAYIALQDSLRELVAQREYCPSIVFRNRTVSTIIDELKTGSKVVWNLVDDTGELLDEELGARDRDGPYEVLQPAMLEVIVIEAEDAARDALFDANLVAVRDFVRSVDPTLGGAVSWIGINTPPERFLVDQESGARAARIRIEMLMDLSTVLG